MYIYHITFWHNITHTHSRHVCFRSIFPPLLHDHYDYERTAAANPNDSRFSCSLLVFFFTNIFWMLFMYDIKAEHVYRLLLCVYYVHTRKLCIIRLPLPSRLTRRPPKVFSPQKYSIFFRFKCPKYTGIYVYKTRQHANRTVSIHSYVNCFFPLHRRR